MKHIINWRVFCLKKLEGDKEYDIKTDGKNDWSEVHINNRKEWENLKLELRSTQKKLTMQLSSKPDILLQETVLGKNYTFNFLLNGIVQHDIYHLGQIGMLDAYPGKLSRNRYLYPA